MQTLPDSVHTPREAGPDAFEDVERCTIYPTVTHDVSIDETEDGQTEITVPISSTTEHRSGGKMTELALESMLEQLESGRVGMWDDHGLDEYGWPEYRRQDMYGWWVGGYIEDETLYGTARLRDGDPRSDDLVDQLEQGMPIGFSVGYYPLDDEWVEREDGEVREIIDVDLVECSSVGLPDNKDAYANAGAMIARSLADAGIELDRHGAEAIGDAVTDGLSTMTGDTDTESNDSGPEANEADDEEEEESSSETHASAEEAATAVVGIYEAHMEAAAEDVQEWLEENAEYDGGDEDDEESSYDDDKDKDENAAPSEELKELRSEIDELRSENEDLKASVDRVESETRESAGRKGMSPPAGEGETHDESPEETRDNDSKPRNGLEEAILLGGN